MKKFQYKHPFYVSEQLVEFKTQSRPEAFMQLFSGTQVPVLIWNLVITGILCIVISGCSILQKTAKKDFNDGYYTQCINNTKQKVYIDIENETVRIHPTKTINNQLFIDTTSICQFYEKEMKSGFQQFTSFNKPSFDIDFFTIPLKYRPQQSDVPQQLNTNLNGAFYVGYRTDKYLLKYIANPKGKVDRNINHFGFSIGVFTGFGNTFLSPTTTNNNVQQEYDGVVWNKGIAGIVAINNFTLGIAFGFDNLLDKNSSYWIYQSKPWVGLAFGLNLN